MLAFNPQKQMEDHLWRERRLEQGWAAMEGFLDRWQEGRISSDQAAIHYATRALLQIDTHRFFHVQVRGEVLDVEENQEHLEREARIDVAFILQSSAADLDPQASVTARKPLLWVERACRILKSFLRVWPVYHFTERRLRAHIFLCALGYVMENHLRQRLLQAGAPYSTRAALEALEPLRVVTYDPAGVPGPDPGLYPAHPRSARRGLGPGLHPPRPATRHPRSLTQPHPVPTRCCDTTSAV